MSLLASHKVNTLFTDSKQGSARQFQVSSEGDVLQSYRSVYDDFAFLSATDNLTFFCHGLVGLWIVAVR